MGWDISYHPMASNEIASIYFAGIENPERAQEIAQEYGVVEFHHENLAIAFQRGKAQDGRDFGTGHAFNLAIVIGYLRPYWYVRGSALSFLHDDPEFSPYFSDWDKLVPASYQLRDFPNRLTQNYCGGVFIDRQALQRLKQDLEGNPSVRQKMDDLFSHGRMAVFVAAMNYALGNNLGLLEAAEVIEPSPFDLNKSTSFSNLHNCDPPAPSFFSRRRWSRSPKLKNNALERRTKNRDFSVGCSARNKNPINPFGGYRHEISFFVVALRCRSAVSDRLLRIIARDRAL